MKNLNEISLKPLEKALSIRFGIPIILTATVTKSKTSQERLSFCSQDLKSHTGILDDVYEFLHITDFGSEVNENDKGKSLWMSIHFSFSYAHGGSNGTYIGNCWYYFDTDTWRFDIP